MIELPRAAIMSGLIAKHAEFFSFGTNDLTQMTFGFSRDDAAKFLVSYYDKKIYEQDPFGKLDQTAMLKNNIEIITININNESQANQFIDTNSFSSFKNLKYIYLVFNFPISQTKIPNIIRNYNDKYSVFYNISIGDSN